MHVIQLFTGSPLRNFTYLIGNQNNQYWCIDPFDGGAIADQISASKGALVGIINTHEHDDHTCGNNELIRRMAPEFVAGHAECGSEIPGFNRGLQAGDNIAIDAEHQLRVIDTPGHSRGHVCLLLEKILGDKSVPEVLSVFSGDILFNAGVGHCRKEGGCAGKLFHTLSDQFYHLPDSVLVYPGHEYLVNNLEFTLSLDADNLAAKEWLVKAKNHDWAIANMVTTIGDERLFNTFFRLSDGVIRQQLNLVGADEKAVFMALRSRRDNW